MEARPSSRNHNARTSMAESELQTSRGGRRIQLKRTTLMIKCAPVPFGRPVSTSFQKTRATAEARSKKGQFYKALPKQFCHDGFQYRQIAREGHAAVYEQRGSGCAERSVSYELIRVRRREGFRI